MNVSLSIDLSYTESHLSALIHSDWLYSKRLTLGGCLELVISSSVLVITSSVAYVGRG